MALLFCDSFDNYATADILERYQFQSTSQSTTTPAIAAEGRTSSAIKWLYSGAYCAVVGLTPRITPGDATGVFGCAFKINSTGLSNLQYIGNGYMFSAQDGADPQISWRLTQTGLWQVYRGPLTTSLGTSSGVPITADTWYYMEAKWTIADSGGTFSIRINGTEVFTYTGDTKATTTATWTGITIMGGIYSNGTVTYVQMNTNGAIWLDDLYLLDGTGSGDTPRDFLGDVTVKYCAPTGVGSTTQWDRGGTDSGANWSQVEETTPDDDSTYVYTSTVDEIDTYAVADAPTGATIKAAQIVVSAKKGDAGTSQITGVTRHSSSNYAHATPAGIAAPTYRHHLFPLNTNPGTGSAFSESDFNNAEFGVKKTA